MEVKGRCRSFSLFLSQGKKKSLGNRVTLDFILNIKFVSLSKRIPCLF